MRACMRGYVLMITVRDDSSATGGLIIEDVAFCLYRIANYARDLHQALLTMLITVKYMKMLHHYCDIASPRIAVPKLGYAYPEEHARGFPTGT